MNNVSIPAAVKAPRALSDAERASLARVAETLIPARGDIPSAAAEPGFWDMLSSALDARSDAFGDIVDALRELALVDDGELWSKLQALDVEGPATFQALSAVITGAWLLTPGVRDRLGYHGQQSDKARLEEAVDEISSGILDAVVERKDTRWIR